MDKNKLLKYGMFSVATILSWEIGGFIGRRLGHYMFDTLPNLHISVDENLGIIYSHDSESVAMIIIRRKHDGLEEDQILIRDTSIKRLLETVTEFQKPTDKIVKNPKDVESILQDMGRESI